MAQNPDEFQQNHERLPQNPEKLQQNYEKLQKNSDQNEPTEPNYQPQPHKETTPPQNTADEETHSPTAKSVSIVASPLTNYLLSDAQPDVSTIAPNLVLATNNSASYYGPQTIITERVVKDGKRESRGSRCFKMWKRRLIIRCTIGMIFLVVAIIVYFIING